MTDKEKGKGKEPRHTAGKNGKTDPWKIGSPLFFSAATALSLVFGSNVGFCLGLFGLFLSVVCISIPNGEVREGTVCPADADTEDSAEETSGFFLTFLAVMAWISLASCVLSVLAGFFIVSDTLYTVQAISGVAFGFFFWMAVMTAANSNATVSHWWHGGL